MKETDSRTTANPHCELEQKNTLPKTLYLHIMINSQYFVFVSTKHFPFICQKFVIMNIQMYAI